MNGYESITNEIISKLEQGVIPWHQTWQSGLPSNAVSKQPYRGVNWLLLSNQQYQSNLWLTFNQCKLLNGIVNKGEHGKQIIYWQIKTRIWTDDLEDEHVDSIPLLRTYTVFNIEQTTVKVEAKRTVNPIAEAEAILDGYDNKPVVVNGEPSYSIDSDKVMMPPISAFDTPDSYYSTLFHEMSHSTGHPTRLNRPIKNHFGSDPYAEEELIAEMSAAYLAGIVGVNISTKTIDNTASYIQHWSSRFTDNVKLIVSLSAKAQKSTDWILGNRYNLPDNTQQD
jgi:antirestriction protein ArdC